MRILLNEDVYNLGEEGDVQDVKRGYARNYLFPKGFALPYTKANIAMIEQRRATIEKRKEEKRKTALSMKERIEETTLDLDVPAGETGRLFGSVTNANIADALEKAGISVERKKVEVPDHHIKEAGVYTVRIRLYASEVAELTVKVNQNTQAAAYDEAAPESSDDTIDADIQAQESVETAETEEIDTQESALAEESVEEQEEEQIEDSADEEVDVSEEE
jgi:large subunit ribosomal protein L9